MSDIAEAKARWEARIGRNVGTSRWIMIDQPMIDQFAQTTVDTQWIHLDAERAEADTPFGGTIAHGFLTLSLASRFAYDCFDMEPGQSMGVNYGFNRLRFLSPVRSGSRVRGHFELVAVTQRDEHSLLREVKLTIEIDGQKTPALVAEWLTMAVFAST
ncbi:MAG: MaoC family dehydratase [Paracoccaceae bacterium]